MGKKNKMTRTRVKKEAQKKTATKSKKKSVKNIASGNTKKSAADAPTRRSRRGKKDDSMMSSTGALHVHNVAYQANGGLKTYEMIRATKIILHCHFT